MNPKIPTPRRSTWWLWLLVLTGTAIMGLMIWAFLKSQKRAKATAGNKKPATLPDGTPPPPKSPAPPPANSPDVHWDYLKDICWKANEVAKATIIHDSVSAYACEVTNGINTMGGNDLAEFKKLYRSWYGRELADDYCKKWGYSGCHSFWGFPDTDTQKTACNRLKA